MRSAQGLAALPRDARRLINREAHRRAHYAPPHEYRKAFERERAGLAAQYAVMLRGGIAVDQIDQMTRDKRVALIEEMKKRLNETE